MAAPQDTDVWLVAGHVSDPHSHPTSSQGKQDSVTKRDTKQTSGSEPVAGLPVARLTRRIAQAAADALSSDLWPALAASPMATLPLVDDEALEWACEAREDRRVQLLQFVGGGPKGLIARTAGGVRGVLPFRRLCRHHMRMFADMLARVKQVRCLPSSL